MTAAKLEDRATIARSTPGVVSIMPVLRAACREAMSRAHPHIGSEDLALAALDGRDGLEAMAAETGLDPAPIRAALVGACHDRRKESDSGGEPRITPRMAHMLSVAAQLASADGMLEIGSLQLIVALLGELDAIAWQGLSAAGLTPEVVVAGVLRRRPPSLQLLVGSAAARINLLHAIGSPLLAWSTCARLLADEPSDRSSALGGDLTRARSEVHALVAAGRELGYLSAPAADAFLGDDPAVAARAYRSIAVRASLS